MSIKMIKLYVFTLHHYWKSFCPQCSCGPDNLHPRKKKYFFCQVRFVNAFLYITSCVSKIALSAVQTMALKMYWLHRDKFPCSTSTWNKVQTWDTWCCWKTINLNTTEDERWTEMQLIFCLIAARPRTQAPEGTSWLVWYLSTFRLKSETKGFYEICPVNKSGSSKMSWDYEQGKGSNHFRKGEYKDEENAGVRDLFIYLFVCLKSLWKTKRQKNNELL